MYMSIFAISDFHTDLRVNCLLLDELTRPGEGQDTMLIAGDIADRLGMLEDILALPDSEPVKAGGVTSEANLFVQTVA